MGYRIGFPALIKFKVPKPLTLYPAVRLGPDGLWFEAFVLGAFAYSGFWDSFGVHPTVSGFWSLTQRSQYP